MTATDDSKLYFSLTSGGGRRISTPGATATGIHPRYILIDDPLSRDEAASYAIRESIRLWYFETLSTRGIARDVCHIVAHQRLHPEDLSGWIDAHDKEMRQLHGESPWHSFVLPMRFDPERVMEDRGYGGDWRTESGELLYPELMDERKVVAVERALGPSATRAQLQQDPRRSDSGLFKVPKLKTITREQLPSMDRMVRAWDLAATEGSGCYAAGVLMGIQRKRSTIANYHSIAPASDRFYVLDVAREQTEDPLGFMRRMAVLDEHSWGRVDLAFEAQPGGAGVILTRQIRDHLRQFDPKPIPPRGSKEQRAEGLASSIAFRELTVVEGDFLSEFLAELERFPGMPCDQVDAASLAYVALTVPSKQIVLVAERSTVPRPSEKCQCGDCKRPMFEKSGFCCDLCLQGTARHTPECHAQYNDWFIRQMPTERGTPRSSSIICRW